MHSSIFVVLNGAIPGAPAARDGRSLALWASVNLFTKGAGMASTAPSIKHFPGLGRAEVCIHDLGLQPHF